MRDAVLPVHHMTSLMLAFFGLMMTPIPAVLVAVLPTTPTHVAGIVLAIVCAATGLIRGMTVSVQLGEDGIYVRNLWRTYRLPLQDVEQIDEARTNLLKADMPAVIVTGRRWRIPLQAATMWGHWLRGGTSPQDRATAVALREWADLHGVPVAGVVARLTDPPRRRRRWWHRNDRP